MNVGDLVNMIQYPYWGLGMVLEIEGHNAKVQWFDGHCVWIMFEHMEKL